MDTIVTPVTVITLDSTRIVHSIKADLVARYFPPVVRLVQYDQSLPVIAVSLMQNGQTYTLPSGAAANIRVHKPDATYVYNPALGCDSTRNIVYFEVTQAMAAANGDGLAIVEIVVDGDIAGTSLITLHFEENPVPEDAIESSDEWETIYELGERIIASTVTPVSTAAGMTDHNVVYLYTGTESGWNQGHMYYYNGTTWVDAGIAVTDKTLTVEGLAADAKKTGEEIADLKDGLTAVESDVTDLKEDIDELNDAAFGVSNFTEGYKMTADGYVVEGEGLCVSDYIAVTPSVSTTVYTGAYASNINAVVFDSNKSYVDNWTVFAGGTSRTFTMNATGAYLRFTFVDGVSAYVTQSDTQIYEASTVGGIGPLSDLTTTDKTNIVSAINEVNAGPVEYPSYYDTDDYLANKIDTINTNSALNGAAFAFITDLHFASNACHSADLLNYIQKHTALNTIISGGDYTEAYGGQTEIDYAKDMTLEYAKKLYPNWFSIRGNHDFTIRTSADASTGITESDASTYFAIVRPSADWRYEVPTPDVDILNSTYKIYKNYNWVLTNEPAKLKIIGLCDYNTTNTSTYYGVSRFYPNAYASYFCQLLKSCDGYTVVVVTHAALVDDLQDGSTCRLTEALNAFVARSSIAFGAYSFDFSSNTGIVACALSGHAHTDQSITADGVLHIGTTCDACYQDDGYGRSIGTITEQAFDVINIDTDAMTIKATRIGGGSDRTFDYNSSSDTFGETTT